MYISQQTEFKNGKAIIFNTCNRLAIFSVQMLAADILADINNEKTVPEGSFIVGSGLGVNYKTRFLPQTRLAVAQLTNTPTVSVKAPNFSFKVGDVLRVKGCFARVKVTGTIATADVITAKIAGAYYTATVGATQTPAGAVADFVTANAAALLTFGITVTASGSFLLVYGTDSHDIFFTISSAAGAVSVETTETGYLGDSFIPLGTISAIGTPAANTGIRLITLTGNAALALPEDTVIGTEYDELLGVYPDPLDFTREPVKHVAVITEVGGVYEANLPFCTKQLKRSLPDLYIRKAFFKQD